MTRSVLLVTSNGFGMGHLVRQLALKAAMPADVRCTILTLSGAAPIAIDAGAELEYCPSYTRFNKRAWHRGYLADRIEALAREVAADVIVFDGVVPYVGLLTAMKRLDVTRVWMRRGVWRTIAQRWPLSYSSFFDLVIEPGDVGGLRDVGPTKSRTDAAGVGVITQAGTASMLPRSEAAARLGVDPNKPTLLLNIGSNRVPDLDEIEQALASRIDWNVITTRDALGRNRSGSSGIGVISGVFPLHPYLSAVDLAVTSVGYNAAHEFLACGVPTVVVPADNATDDQYARAEAMAEIGAAVVARPDQGQPLFPVIAALLDDAKSRAMMSEAARTFAATWGEGAKDAVQLIRTARPRRHGLVPGLRLLARRGIEQALALAARARSGEPQFATTISMADMTGTARIEHLHPGLSAAYRARREEIARSW